MAVHTGEARLRDDANYAGQAIIRAARLRAIAHGGQVLVSGGARDLAVDQAGERFEFRALGEHRLRDLDRPAREALLREMAALALLDRTKAPRSRPSRPTLASAG